MFKKILSWLMILLWCFAGVASAADSMVSKPKIAKFITIADIHFDPFLECKALPRPCAIIKKLQETDAPQWRNIFEQYQHKKTSPYYLDTSYAVLHSMLIQLKIANKKEKPQFVMILGDFLSHNFRDNYIEYSQDQTQAGYQRFVKKIIQFLTEELNGVFPTIDVYPVVGNNDSYTEDYSSVPNGSFFKDTAKTWSAFIKDPINKKSFMQTFPYSGYYSVLLSKNNRVFVLNTVLFSTSSNHLEAQKKAAQRQLSWLHAQLLLMKDRYALLAYHIPMGFDLGKSNFSKMQKFWFTNYSAAFKKELKLFSTAIQGMFYGHLHLSSLQILTFKVIENVRAYFTPSVSPILGNQPSFSIYHYQVDNLKIIENEVSVIP